MHFISVGLMNILCSCALVKLMWYECMLPRSGEVVYWSQTSPCSKP